MNTSESLSDIRPAMLLLCDSLDIFSHCARIVVQEKDVECFIKHVPKKDAPALLGKYSPYIETPILVDRDVALYDMWVILEYLDERFPHPPLMPVDPITRAKVRLAVTRLTRDWLQPISELTLSDKKPNAALKKSLHSGLLSLSDIFIDKSFFLGSDYSLVDAYFAPLLWRLPMLGIELPTKQAEPLLKYAEALFERPTFRASLSDPEIELR